MDRADPVIPPPPPVDERCYRHPDVSTGVHCTRCGRAICTECMQPAPVGHQCPECVREAKAAFRRGPGRRDAVANAKGVPGVTILLVLLGLGYVWSLSRVGLGSLIGGPSALDMFAAGGGAGVVVDGQGIGLAAGQYWRLVTPIFLHYGLFHLAVNAYSLWIIGQMVEREYGRWRLIALFLATGIFASGASYWLGPPGAVGAGASGAVFGLLGVILAHAYQRRGTAMGAMRMKMIGQVLLLNIIITFVSPRIDWRAHLGGFVAGAIAGYVAEPGRGTAVANAIGIAMVAVAGVAVAVMHTSALTGA